jgi:hypothetical protein
MAVLAATLPGMPLIYGGQESGLDKRIEFFEKDPVQWKTCAYAPCYTGLLKLKHGNPALWNGSTAATSRCWTPATTRCSLSAARAKASIRAV